MKKVLRQIQRISYPVFLLAFILPFCLVKCGDDEVASIQGTDLVFGGEVEYDESIAENKVNNLFDRFKKDQKEPEEEGEDELQEESTIEINYWAFSAFALGALGLALVFFSYTSQFALGGFTALASAICLSIMFLKIKEQIPEFGNKLVTLELGLGIKIAYAVLILQLVISLIGLSIKDNKEASPVSE